MSGILDGIRVVDMSRYISGPYCAMMLADMGAEVIKVEKPGEGEIYRVGGPWKDGVSLVFQAMNRNKKSVTADTRSPEGLQLIKELILHSDVLIENFRAGVMEKMGLGYEELHKLNPRLIMVSITGFGHSGPLRDRMAFDGIISAMSGVTRIDGDMTARTSTASSRPSCSPRSSPRSRRSAKWASATPRCPATRSSWRTRSTRR